MQQDEQIIFRTRPSFHRVGFLYLVSAFLSLIAAAVTGYFGGPFFWVVISAAIFFLFPIFRHIERNHIVYTLTNIAIEIESGIFSRTVRNIPLRSVQDVTTRIPFVKGLLGLGDVLIDSAALTGKIPMRNVSRPREFASLILTQLHRWESEFDLAPVQRGGPPRGVF